MTLNSNASPWLKPAFIALVSFTILALWLSIAGGIFLAKFKMGFRDASPLTLYRYWYWYPHAAHVRHWIGISTALSAAILAVAGVAMYSPSKRPLFGEARFASRRDMAKAGLLGDSGILVGKVGGDYLKFDGPEHVLLVAPTRERKGVSVVIPNALSWQGPMVVLDTKAEIADITSGYRSQHQPVFFFNPVATDYRTHRYNPLAYVAADPNLRVNDVQKIGSMLFPDIPGTATIWTATPRSLFLGIVLYLFETPEKMVTLGQVLRETLVDGDGAKYFAKTINDRAKRGDALSQECVLSLNTYISIAADVTRAGIMAGFRSRLELWMSPLVDAATSANDFDLRDLRKKPMTIYVCVTQDNLERLAPLINLFIQQLVDLNTRVLPSQDKSLKYTCLLLMDELTSIGKVPALAKGIAYLAGYGLRLLSVIQSPGQLVEIGSRESASNFTANHGLQIAFAPKATETDTAEAISKWLGYMTVKGGSKSKSRNGVSESESSQKRALLLPQEVVALGIDWSIVVKRGMPPARVRKIEYYSDPNFMERLLPPATVPVIDMAAHNQLVRKGVSVTVTAPSAGIMEVVRNITAADIPNLGNLALSQFVLDFSQCAASGSDSLNLAALNAYADLRSKEMGLTVL